MHRCNFCQWETLYGGKFVERIPANIPSGVHIQVLYAPTPLQSSRQSILDICVSLHVWCIVLPIEGKEHEWLFLFSSQGRGVGGGGVQEIPCSKWWHNNLFSIDFREIFHSKWHNILLNILIFKKWHYNGMKIYMNWILDIRPICHNNELSPPPPSPIVATKTDIAYLYKALLQQSLDK